METTTDPQFKVRDAWWYPEQSIGIKVELLREHMMNGQLVYVISVQDTIKVVSASQITEIQRVL